VFGYGRIYGNIMDLNNIDGQVTFLLSAYYIGSNNDFIILYVAMHKVVEFVLCKCIYII